MKTASVRSFLAGALAGIVLTTITTFGADYQATVMADSPAGYWRLGEMPLTYDDPIKITTNSGSLGDGGTGTLIGYVRRNQSGALAGSTDTAYRFWAGDGRVNITNSAPFNFTGTTAFTLEVWAKPTIPPTTTSQRLLSNGSSGQGYGFTLQGNNLLRLTAFGVVDRNSDAVATPWDTNQWYHFVVVRSNTAVFFYVNGALLGTPKVVSGINTTLNPLALGARPDGAESFTGLLDEPAVYTNVLAADRIAAHYSAGTNNGSGYAAVVLADGPIGYWHLNEPPKTESPSIIANSGAVGTSADGHVFGSLNSLTGGLTGAPLGDPNTAIAFAGQNGKIDVPQNAALNTSNFTVECWANLGAWGNSHQSPVSSRNSGFGGTLGYILYAAPLSTAANAPRWEFWTGPGWDVVSGASADVVLNQWTHLVGTYDAATGSKLLYVNGQLISGKVNVLLAPNTLSPLRIGAGATENPGGSFFWNGGIDEVAVYPSVLSPGRVLSHYEAAMGAGPVTVVAPAAVINPAGQTNWAPYPVTLSAVMSGTLPMQFQWYRVSPDGLTTNALADGTNLVLRLDPTSPALDGNYFVSASNSVGYAESAWAWVEITPLTLPSFVLNAPATVPVYAGGTAGIPLVVTGTPPMNFQWQSNTLAITGGTNAILALPNVQSSFSAATFQATVSNPAGAATSDPAQLSVLTPTASSYAAQATTLNPLAYWRLGEPSGTLAFDYWGPHPAVYVNTLQGSTPGALLEDDDGAVTLQGTGSYIRTLEAAPFSFSGFQDFTLSSFVKVTTAPAANTPVRIFSNWQGATATNVSSGFGFGLYGMTKLRFTAFGIVDLDANVSALSTDTWYHLAAVRSNNWVYLYINGVLANSGAVGAVRASAFPLQLGGNPNAGTTESFSGLLDEAAVFGRALSATEITSLYNARYGSLLPPNIVQQPSPSKVFAGGTARFSVQAIGSTPIGYLWKANNIAIPDATNSSLVVTGLTLANNGTTYTVTITNRAGTLTSVPALLSVTQPSGYSAAVVADRPVSLYRLGEASGPLVYDAWGGFNGQDNGAVLFGAPGALLGDPDTAATFDGTSSRIDIPYAPDLNPPVFSIEAWAKVTGGQGTYRAVISARDEGTGFEKGFIIYASAGNVWTFWVGDGAVWQTLNGPAIAQNEWTHLAAVYDGQTKSFYVNGNLVGTQTIGYVPNNLRSLRIGAGRNEFDTPPVTDPTLYYFNGSIDEVAVYRTVLSAQRIAYHYALGYYGNNTAPLMLQEPISQTVSVGTPVTLQAQAGGSPTLTYQWLKDGQPLAGATTPSLTASAAGYADNGVYVLAVTNSVGYTNSVAARLTVLPPPTFALLTNDLVLHLRFDGNCDDSSGRFNNGIPYGAVSFVPGRVGANALHYYTDTAASSYNYVYLGQVPDLLFGTDASFSFSYWVRFSGSPGDLPFITSAVQSFSNPGFTFAPSYRRGGWSWSLGDGTGYIGVNGADNSINDGNWHHLAHLFDRTNAVAITCLDGVPVNTRALPFGRSFDTSDNIMVGQDPTGLYGENGSADIDDIGVWRRALTTYEAQSIYAAGAAGASFDVTAPIHLAVQISGADVLLLWQAGTLQQSDTPGGSYTPVQGAQAPSYKLTPGIGKKFYRVK